MAFYDSVKEDIRDENDSSGGSEENEEEDRMAFDQLKENAEKEEDQEEQGDSSGTDIEVVGKDDLSQGGKEKESGRRQEDGGREPAGKQRQERSARDQVRETVSTDDGVAEVLQRIEQQNDEMLDVLRGIKRSLE